jgi:hypothetical protein
MDQSINAALAQCANLYKQRRLAQKVVVPISVEYHMQSHDTADPIVVDTVDITAQGQLLYAPYHTEVLGQAGPLHLPGLAFIPDALNTILQGKGVAQTAVGGGDFPVPAILVSISGRLPLGPTSAFITLQCPAVPECDFSSAFDDTVLPIELKKVDSLGITDVILHLGNAELVIGPVMLGTNNVQLGG